ncbi:TetR/AcrR family transcriptional regulator [Brevibacterium sp. HMSC22B09]|uniref:TetR/AcrR family transcriptional regulator n=1 Tax=Brevibacterium sp. HMSC22B09 TaxID=1581055 RepID=UPI0008A2E597|nr:TetR/AcrR family transcriptional regulator [Brevibacterium sp. HMSC22B09]OFT99565.1 hypothetical protein HMPREF3087_00110 [Brevibacterium sp. HMSC22B09]
MTEQDSLRVRKQNATRSALHAAAVELVYAGSLETVTTAQIAEAAGVSPRTFFNYYDTKEDAIIGLSDQTLNPQRLAEYVADCPLAGSPLEDVSAVMRSVYSRIGGDDVDKDKRKAILRRYPMLVRRNVEIARGIEKHLAEQIADRVESLGVQLPDGDRTVVGRMIIRVCSVPLALAYQLSGEGQEEFDRTFADTVDLCRQLLERMK